ncbi:MAG: hypothetical protein JSU87_09810 [Gemmatimonadota bacterium]|nr:MAG: hypothetical protein JSU87_09810 [Gemmatimonadota bacterium]
MEDPGTFVSREHHAQGPQGLDDDEGYEVSLLELANVLLKRRRLVVGFPVVAAVLMAIISLILPTKFTATTTFVPESESEGLSLPSGLAGLASQFGVAIPGGGANSPRFYSGVLESRTLRDQVLLAMFPDPRSQAPEDSATLLEILGVEGRNRTRRLEKGRDRLEEMMSVMVDNETNIVSVSVETRHPALSAQVANLVIDLLNRFNLETRQSNARERRRFTGERLSEAENELQEAEDVLQEFLRRNRQFSGSPELTFEHERLQRQVTIKQEVLTTLRRSYEEARIEEVNDTPVITVIDHAVAPDKKSSPKRKLNVVLAFFVAAVLGVFGSFGLEFTERLRARDEQDFREFSSQWAAVKSELKSLVRRRRRRSAD